ncbi:hypothetical protein GOBAR_DD33303 [Gossypium barbadense]|nr:hypothetical protein GOBAR_DD33303 [Gossypium barbadense]
MESFGSKHGTVIVCTRLRSHGGRLLRSLFDVNLAFTASVKEKQAAAKLVDISLISDDEIEWLNNYHSQVWEKVGFAIGGRFSSSMAMEQYTSNSQTVNPVLMASHLLSAPKKLDFQK